MRPAISRGQFLGGRVLLRVALAAGLLAVASPSAFAQQRRTYTDTVSAKALAESLKVVDSLDKFTRAHPKDAAAWFRLGSLASMLWPHSRGVTRGIDFTALQNHAFFGFERAVKYDSTNARYWAAYAKFAAPQGAYGKNAASAYDKALALGRAHHDTALVTELLLLRGTKEWSNYTNSTRYAPPIPVAPPSTLREDWFGPTPAHVGGDESVWRMAGNDTTKDLPRLLRGAIDYVTHNMQPIPFDRAGESAYLMSSDALAEAHDLAPSNAKAYRGLATLYAARGRWNELASLAHDRTVREPKDPWGWMALGLSMQRLRASSAAESAFAKGLARLDPAERAWLDRIDRILDPRDSVTYAHADAKARAETWRLLWENADPLWAADEETPRIEFLARLAFAELRWSDSTRHIHGADTHMGEVYIRYGPADKVAGNFWIYNSGLIFSANAWNTHYDLPNRPDRDPDDQDTMERIRRWQPSRWDNIALSQIDSMPTQVARFREGPDSVSVFLATQAPMAELHRTTVSNAKAVAHYWLNSRDGATKLNDSLVLGGSGAMQFTRRVPAGPYYYRVEAIVPGSLAAARTAAPMMMGADTTGFTTLGFGMSDVLIASQVTPRGTQARWSDFDVTPLLGDLTHGTSVGLVWENYDLRAREGAVSYTVKLTIERKWKMFLNKIRARIINSWALMMGVEQTSERVIFRYDRTAPQAPVVADFLTLDLADTPAGTYDLTLEITDNVTRRSTARTMRVVVGE